MLREKSPLFRVWFVIFVGVAGPTLITIVGRPVEELFTIHTLLEVVRAGIGGAVSATIALFVEKPRHPTTRSRSDDPSVPGGPVEDRRRLPPDVPVIVVATDPEKKP